jgi:peptidyl-tRNA hydrolase, PTH1 family
MTTRLVIGLGNPGERYARTRHNVGFMVVDALARECATSAWRRQDDSSVCAIAVRGAQVALAKPLTFINLSGHAVELMLARYGLEPQDMVVVCDDLNLPFGRIRVRARGSSGGHRGLESIIGRLGIDEIPRVRLGIGEENMPADKAEFVLTEFPAECEKGLDEMIARGGDAVKLLVSDGVERAMSVFNAQGPTTPD